NTMPEMRWPIRGTLPPLVLAAALVLVAGAAHAGAPTAYMTSETGGVGVIDLDQMSLAKTFPVGTDGPRGLSLNADGTLLF
ncbi:hypothetical protein SB757_33635, partial [Pseudomonas sp. SIMBA_065]